MRRVTITLSEDLWEAIRQTAEREIRFPKQQIIALLRRDLLGNNTEGLIAVATGKHDA